MKDFYVLSFSLSLSLSLSKRINAFQVPMKMYCFLLRKSKSKDIIIKLFYNFKIYISNEDYNFPLYIWSSESSWR